MIFSLIFTVALLAQENDAVSIPPVWVSAPPQWSESRDEISGERWTNSGASPESALAKVTGLAFSQNGGPGQPRSVFIRGARAEDTLVLFNGIPLNDPLSPSRAFDFGQIPSGNLEKIEVIKGPQSVLYGSDAQGGVIHFHGKKDQASPTVRLQGGSYNTYDASGSWQGLGFGYFQTKGFSAADFREGNTERDGSKSWNVNATKTFPLNSSSEIQLGGLYHNNKTDTDRNGGRGGDSVGTQTKGSQFLFQAEGKHKVDDRWKLLPFASIFYRDRDDNTVSVVSYSSRQMRLGTKAEAQFGSMKQLIGWQSEQESGTSAEIPGKKKLSSHALYSHLFIPWKKWEFDGGIRGHQETKKFLSWNLGARYWLLPSLSWKANWAQGSKRPSLYQLYSNYGNTNLSPSRSTSKESSLQWTSDEFSADLTFFENNTKNLIDFDLISSRYFNIGRTRNRGIELSSSWQGKDLELQQSFTRLWSIDRASGLNLYRRPHYQWSHELNMEPLAQWTVQLGGRLVGHRDDVHPQLFTRQKLSSFYVVNGGAAYLWEKDKKIGLRIDNIANRVYQETSGFGTPERSFYLSVETAL